ncbi:hypothetical protein Vafri_7906 [Volvox africanus]|uniref:RAP domain-containing protein n=1 Tax=Volvox africanus TaxID=51714 RepID=A0A8J4B2C9_9CHLO|nr:hypothetical protein Vafri_7906 [Volvox africanus]
MLQQSRPVQCYSADAYICKRVQITHVSIICFHVLVQRVGLQQRSGLIRRQLARCPATSSSSTAAAPNPPFVIARTLRDLAKASLLPRDRLARADLDVRIDSLATQFRSTTADGTLANNRDLGSIVWSLAKLSTPCCCGHAIALLTALTSASSSSPASLQSASNQTLCKALYGAALLSRDSSSRTATPRNTRGNSSSETSISPTHWSALLPPARALAAACVPRLASFNMLDTSNVWWAIATLASLPPPPSAVFFRASIPFHTSGGLASSKLQKQHKQQRHQVRKPLEGEGEGKEETSGVFSLPEGLLPGLAAAAERHMRTPNGCSTQGLANMLWGASRLGYVDERMLAAAVALLKPQVRTLASTDSRAFATCLWAFASLRYVGAEGLLSIASRPAAAHVGAFDDQSLANLLWAYGTSGVEAPKLFAASADELARRANRMPIEFLAICLWAFATANHLDSNMMAVVAHSLTGLSSPPSPPSATGAIGLAAGKSAKHGRQAMNSGAVSAASTVPGPAGLIPKADWEAALAERLAACQGRRTQAIGNLAWAYAALGARHDPLVSALAGRAAAMATALNAQELSNVLYSIARLVPYFGDTRPDVLEVLLQEVDRRVKLGQEQHDQAGTNRRNRRNQLPRQPESSSTKFLREQIDSAETGQVELPATSGLMSHSPFGAPGEGALSPAQRFNPRDLAMLAWSLAILAPASFTLLRILKAAVAAVDISSSDVISTATETGDAADAGDTELDELQIQPYNLFGLVQLYGANYAACLAAATPDPSGGNTDKDLHEPNSMVMINMDVKDYYGDGDYSYSKSCGDGGCSGGGGGGGGGGGDGGGDKMLVRAAAAAMLQAQRAAEAIGRDQGRGINKCTGDSEGHNTGKAALAAGKEGDEGRREAGRRGGGDGSMSVQSGGVREMVLFGPLGACPPLFRACRNAWFLNTASTKPSDLQSAVAALLRNHRWRGSGSGGGEESSTPGSCGSGGAVASKTRGEILVAEEALTPDRMLRVDLLVQYNGRLVLLEVDGPSHFAVELNAKPVDTANGDSSGVRRISDTMPTLGGTGSGCNDDGVSVQGAHISATAYSTSCGKENEDGDANFHDSDDNSYEKGDRLVTAGLREGKPARGNSKCSAAAAVALRRLGPLRPLGDTVLRNRFLAASLGLQAAGFQEGALTVYASTGVSDPWVIQSLLVQLPPGSRPAAAAKVDGEGALVPNSESVAERYGCAGQGLGQGRDGGAVGPTAWVAGTGGSGGGGTACAASASIGGAGDTISSGCGNGNDSGLVRGVAVATLSYAEWNAAGSTPGDKWARCLQPLLARYLG